MKRFAVIILLVTAVAGFAVAEDLLGLEIVFEAGIMHNNLFQLYENDLLTEEVHMGSNFYFDTLMRFYVWRFFLEGDFSWTVFGIYVSDDCMTFGGALGFVPWDPLTIKVGMRYKDLDILAMPVNYQSTFMESYVNVSLKLGKTWP